MAADDDALMLREKTAVPVSGTPSVIIVLRLMRTRRLQALKLLFYHQMAHIGGGKIAISAPSRLPLVQCTR